MKGFMTSRRSGCLSNFAEVVHRHIHGKGLHDACTEEFAHDARWKEGHQDAALLSREDYP
jgi:hypothetical protein